MKTIIIITILFFTSFISAFSTEVEIVKEAKYLLNLQKTELISSQKEITNLRSSLNLAESQIVSTQNQLNKIENKIEIVRNWGIEQNKQKWKYFEESEKIKKQNEKLTKKYKFSKRVNATTAAILGLFLGLWLMQFFPVYVKYKYLLPILLPVVGYSLIWILL
jgi:TolA-binding protein